MYVTYYKHTYNQTHYVCVCVVKHEYFNISLVGYCLGQVLHYETLIVFRNIEKVYEPAHIIFSSEHRES